ncbi:Mediator of RNA polymerase II transcription subunit 31 [Phytophthora megakarya]|uniref:Mediator of RNA polymerase II transcription subunit 31 n=1 Tax=Phytophthora megakarya TaxID=4795 RepID=A0A225VZY4_9STRA|nr:Mediator of RNA polymerase II transcription subunit 31 [Phytophthora megakarya]
MDQSPAANDQLFEIASLYHPINQYFEYCAFMNYLQYIEYWKQPQYAKYINHQNATKREGNVQLLKSSYLADYTPATLDKVVKDGNFVVL